MIRKIIALAALSTAAACVSPTAGGSAPLPQVNNPPLKNVAGLEMVMGKTAGQLMRMFGEAQADVLEPPARKLQFSSGACVLDAYLYPQQGGGEAKVTHIDARRSDGAEVDRAACVNALRR